MRPLLLSSFKYSLAVLRSVLIIANNFYCIPTHVVWLWLLTPMRRFLPALYNRIEGHLFSWLLAMVSLWSWSAGYDIVEEGDDISRCLGKRTLVMVNHQSTADVPMLMAAFNAKPGVLNQIMWIMDRMFRYTNFGVVSSYHRDFFISSGKARREESVRQLKDHLTSEYIPLGRKWMVLFPEGGFLTKRKPISQRFAEKMNLPLLHNVTVPRMGALLVIRDTLMTKPTALLKNGTQPSDDNKQTMNGAFCTNNNNVVNINAQNARDTSEDQRINGEVVLPGKRGGVVEESDQPELDFILDITIGYPDGKPLNLQNILTGLREPCQTVLFYRVYPAGDIPRDDASLSQWTYDRFFEKEKLLAGFYKNRTFVAPKEGQAAGHMNLAPCPVQQDLLRFLILHLFYLTSTYFHYRVLATVVENCIAFYSSRMVL